MKAENKKMESRENLFALGTHKTISHILAKGEERKIGKFDC